MAKKEGATQEPEIKKTVLQMAEEKAEILTAEYKEKGIFKVHAIVFKNEATDEDIVGFVKEPSRMAKMAVLDKAAIGGYTAAEEILDSVLIKEHSDPRMFSESQEFDDIHMGLVMAVYKLITFKTNQLKKKIDSK